MDLNDLRSAVTLLAFIAFAGVVAWAWNRRRLADFDEAARLPFVSADVAAAADAPSHNNPPEAR